MHSYVILPATLCCSMQHHGPVSPNLLRLTLHNPKLARHWSRFRFLFDPENFLVREPELFTGQREVLGVQRWRKGRRSQGGGAAGWSSGRGGWGRNSAGCVSWSREPQIFLQQIYGITGVTGFTTFLRRSCCSLRSAPCGPQTALRHSCSWQGCWNWAPD